jgi:hypothetical protein
MVFIGTYLWVCLGVAAAAAVDCPITCVKGCKRIVRPYVSALFCVEVGRCTELKHRNKEYRIINVKKIFNFNKNYFNFVIKKYFFIKTDLGRIRYMDD